MKILVATRETQGRRRSDFNFCEEGEPVTYGFECSNEPIDGKCGCHRSLTGFLSHKATTTFKLINDVFATKESIREAIGAKLIDEGWGDSVADEHATITFDLYNGFSQHPIGTIIERRGAEFFVRGPRVP